MEHRKLKAQSSLTLRHERLVCKDMPGDVDIFEGFQHLVLASVDGQDLLFWFSFYVQEGRTGAGFLGQAPAVLNTMTFTIPQDRRVIMNDNDFICNGWNPAEHLKLEDLEVTSTEKSVTWRLKNAAMVCHPPYWELKGHHGEIAFDLKITGTTPTSFYMKGDFESLIKGQSKGANFDQLTSCTGTISVGEKTYQIAEGYGCHEHPVATSGIVEGFRRPMHWFVGGGDRLQFFNVHWGTYGKGHVQIDDKYLTYNSGITLHVLDWWHDPRSLATIPCKWHINMCSSEGILDVHAVASGRANRIWALRNGYVLDLWILGTINGSFLHPNGQVIPIKDTLFALEWLRTIWG